MADNLCFFNKDTFIIKPSKKSPPILRMVVILFSMVCSFYICSICLKQIGTNSMTIDTSSMTAVYLNVQEIDHHSVSKTFLDVNEIHQSCNSFNVQDWEKPYIHYPEPKTFKRLECACNPVRFFAILSMQRSGSGWFETLLNNHTNVSSNGEIFSVKERRSNVSEILRTMDKVYNLDWLSSASKNECSSAAGFKWMLNQGLMAHHEEILEYFNRKGVSVIFLFRRNLLRRMVSVLANAYDSSAKLLHGTHKSHVHSPDEANTLAQYKPTINSTLLISNLKHDEETTAKALEYFKSTRHIILYYEDLVGNQTKLMEVQEFLRIPRMDLKSRQVKIHKGSLSKQVSNWDDVHNAIKGTHYENYLQADYNL